MNKTAENRNSAQQIDNSSLPPVGQLHPLEHRLIIAIRYKYDFSDIMVKTRHGLPYRFIITERFEDLSSDTFIDSFKHVQEIRERKQKELDELDQWLKVKNPQIDT